MEYKIWERFEESLISLDLFSPKMIKDVEEIRSFTKCFNRFWSDNKPNKTKSQEDVVLDY